MTINRDSSVRAFTIVEMMVAMSCGLFVLATLLVAGIALQRSYMAVQAYSIAVGDQLRVQDYMALDCRRSLSATITACDGSICPNGSNVLTLTVPAFYDAWGNVVNPSFTTGGALQYGASPVTIKYYQAPSGGVFLREVAGVAKGIATNVDSFTVVAQDLTSTITCSIKFAPRFVSLPNPAPIDSTLVFSQTFLRNASAWH